jgi:folylpolyglutamate synthase
VRERIRVNGHPLPEHLFAKYFFQVWDRLSSYTSSSSHALASTSSDSDLEEHLRGIPEKPVYFRFLTLLAYHVFISLRVKLTVLEVGIGGTYDSTNLVPKPLATGVTALGLDHTFVLGNTVQEIAWNKGGIFKEGVPALAVEQDEGAKVAENTLRERAIELKVGSSYRNLDSSS